MTDAPRPIAAIAALVLLVAAAGCASTPRSQPMTAAPPAAEVDATDDGVTLNPYHAVVRGKVLRAFRGLTAHDPEPALALMAEDVHYTFEGEHALGGTRVTRAGVRTWFGRLFRLSPGAFVIHSVEIMGWPWSTRVLTTFDHWVEPPDEPPYWGHGIQIVDLEWGAAKRIRTMVDTARLARTLQAMRATGVVEATAAPILD
jgi:hypothetical protein